MDAPSEQLVPMESLSKLLECSICMDIFESPKMLPCQHSFCLRCVKDVYAASPDRMIGRIECPVCRKLYQLDMAGGKKKPKPPTADQLDKVLQNNLTLIALLETYNQSRKLSITSQNSVASVTSAINHDTSNSMLSAANSSNGNSCGKCSKVMETSDSEISTGCWRCVQCNLLLCPECVRLHYDNPETAAHELLCESDADVHSSPTQLETVEHLNSNSPPSPPHGYRSEISLIDQLSPVVELSVSAPAVPPRRYPSDAVEVGSFADVVRSMTCDEQGCIFASFLTSNRGIEKLNVSGQSVLKFCNAESVLSLAVMPGQKFILALCSETVTNDSNQSVQEYFINKFNKETGQFWDHWRIEYKSIADTLPELPKLFVRTEKRTVVAFESKMIFLDQKTAKKVHSVVFSNETIVACCASQHYIYVLLKSNSSTINHNSPACLYSFSMEVFNEHGKSKYSIELGKLKNPRSVDVYKDSYFFIADPDAHRVAIFEKKGNELKNKLSIASYYLWKPVSTCVFGDSLLIADSCRNYGVYRWKLVDMKRK